MTSVLDVLAGAARDLQALKCDFAVVGGIAVSARTTPRTTNGNILEAAIRIR